MSFQDLIADFARSVGVDLEPADGHVSLTVDGMSVAFHDVPEREAVVLVGEIGEPPPERLENLLSAMLEANHLFTGTFGATLSRDPETGTFFLCQSLATAALDGGKFHAAVEQFVNAVETWRKMLADYRPEDDDGDAEESVEEAPRFGASGFVSV